MTVTELRPRRPHTVFVLGGGGNLGSIQVGMLQALADRGIQPDAVVGASVGALNGATIAARPGPEGIDILRRAWLDPTTAGVFSNGRMTGPWLLFRKGRSMVSNQRLRELIERSMDARCFEDLEVPLHVVATSLHTGRPRWFTAGDLVEPILASAALPAVLPPVDIDGETYIDGAVVDNVPITKAIELGAERIVVLHVGNFERPRPDPQRPIDVLLQAFSIARNERFLREIDAHLKTDGVELLLLPGVDPGGLRRNDFSRSAELMARSRTVAGAYLDSLAVAM